MNDDNGFGVPAGWYPDPLGLPQMRWWDNHGWTEHTTEARAPIVIQEAKLAWADDDAIGDELPTRRERREREREGGSGAEGSSTHLPTADVLLELEPPSWDVLPADEPAPDQPMQQQQQAQPQTQTQTRTERAPQHATTTQHLASTGFAPGSGPSANTPGAWIIALMPLLQLVATLLVVTASGAGGTNAVVVAAIWIAPYLIAIPLAISDRKTLRRNGYEKTASWLWVLLSGPVYLIARAISIVMRAGNGFGPILVWGALVLLQLGSVVAVPGVVISALPQVFASEAAQSIEHDASVFGSVSDVICPAPPATVMGQEFSCRLTEAGSTEAFEVTAALVRENGWIAWQVTDWGVYSLSR